MQITSIVPCDESGNPHTPLFGESYGMRVNYTISGTAAKKYTIRFQIANQVRYWQNIEMTGPGNYWIAAAWGPMPLDGNIPLKATLDYFKVTGDTNFANNTLTGRLQPIMPTVPIEFYAPQNLRGTNDFNVVCSGAPYSKLQIYTGTPISESAQTVLSLTPPPGSLSYTAAPFGQPVRYYSFLNPTPGQTYSISQSFEVQARNVRANFSKKYVSWAMIDSVPSNIALYKNPEAYVDSNNSAIGTFVTSAVGNNYRSTMTPIVVARKIFQKTIQRLTYQSPTSTLTATDAYTSQVGDCGGFARLYVAGLRRVGIPARTVQGWVLGTNQTHIWAEMWLPGFGWIPQDANVGDSYCSNGAYVYGFAGLTDLNNRVASSRGGTMVYPEGFVGAEMQSGVFLLWGGSGTSSAVRNFHVSLAKIP